MILVGTQAMMVLETQVILYRACPKMLAIQGLTRHLQGHHLHLLVGAVEAGVVVAQAAEALAAAVAVAEVVAGRSDLNLTVKKHRNKELFCFLKQNDRLTVCL